MGPDIFDDLVEAGEHSIRLQIEADAAHVRLVSEVRGIDFQGHREADDLGRRHGIRGGGGCHGAVHRNAVGREDGLGFQFREDPALPPQALVYEGPGRRY